jgi:L-fuconolactonase
MIVDAHQHFWRYNARRHAWITDAMQPLKRDFLPADLEPELIRNHVDGCIAVQAEQSDAETEFLLELAAHLPRIVGVIGWIDLTSPTIEDHLRYYTAFRKLRGFRHIAQDEPDDRFLVRKNVLRGIKALHRFRYTYDILIYHRQLRAALELVSRLPDQRFVIDHIAKPDIKSGNLEPWASQIRRIAAYPNVYCKLSGLVTEARWDSWKKEEFRPFLDTVWQAFGADRLMFGSDWPVCLLAADYARVKQLIEGYVQQFTESDRDQVFGKTAACFYGLESPSS